MRASASFRIPKPVDEPAQYTPLAPAEEVELDLPKLLQESFVT
jgi:hypothetical protein